MLRHNSGVVIFVFSLTSVLVFSLLRDNAIFFHAPLAVTALFLMYNYVFGK